MQAHRNEEFPHRSLRNYWPREFKKRRNFSREAENETYVDFVQQNWFLDDSDEDDLEEGEEHSFEEGDEDRNGQCEDEVAERPIEANEKEDEKLSNKKGVELCNRYGNVKIFMKGLAEDEAKLQYRDQVEKVAGFCEETWESGPEKMAVALLDDRNSYGTNFASKGCCRPYLGPLTSQELRVELLKQVQLLPASWLNKD